MFKKSVRNLILAATVALFTMLSPAFAAAGTTPIEELAEKIKVNFDGWSASQVQNLMAQHYMRLRLMDTQGNWAAPELAAISSYLLPGDVDGVAVKAFIDIIAKNASDNKYLEEFTRIVATQIADGGFAELVVKVNTEGPAVFTDAVGYALMLERMTNAMYNDHNFLDACTQLFPQAGELAGMYEYMGEFEQIKLQLVEAPMHMYVDFHNAGSVPENFMQTLLPQNIDAAVYADSLMGNMSNAAAGMVLSANKPGDPGAAPTRFSDDGKALLFCMEKPKEWADLYSSWNLAFVTHYEHFPYTMAKLLIPKVSGYQDAPQAYIYNRSLALYTHLYYALIGNADAINHGVQGIKWKNDDFTQLWGQINNGNAQDYIAGDSRIDFNIYSPVGMAGQDKVGEVTIEDDGRTLALQGNRWQQISYSYTITPDTVIELDFQSDAQAEAQGIGFNDASGNYMFHIRFWGTDGTPANTITDYTYSGSGVQHFVIPIGQYFTGDVKDFWLINDQDAYNPNANSRYSNIVISERKTYGAVHQAETFTAKHDFPSIQTAYAGYTDSGYVNLGKKPDRWVEWNNFYAPVTGDYTITFTYGNGRLQSYAWCDAIINGTNQGTVDFAKLGTWDGWIPEYWSTDSITVHLESGYNTIKLLTSGGNGGPVLDKMEIVAAD